MRAETNGTGPGSELRRMGGRASVSEVVGLVLALDERSTLTPNARRARDLEVASRVAVRRDVEILRVWLRLAPSPALALRIRRVGRAFAGIRLGFSLLGGVLGWCAAAALLGLGGPHGRVSIAGCVALLVAFPFASWLASLLFWLGSLAAASFPRGSATEPVRGSPRLLRLALRFVPSATRLDVEAVLGRARAQAGLYAPLQRGQLMSWLSQAGFFFGLGALAATLGFVVFTDLAFGWSTTLDVAPERVQRFVAAVAKPWAGFWPEASPSLELVTATRHFRVAPGPAAGGTPPLVFGAWWPFLVMAIGCYAVLPRLLVLPVVGSWLARESARAMRFTPGAAELVDSLTMPQLESRAERAEGPVGRALAGMVPEVELRTWLARGDQASPSSPFVVVWADAASESALRNALGSDLRIAEAGGRRTLAEDEAVVTELRQGDGPVVVAVRGQESPILDLLDFLAALRGNVGAAKPICVLLVGGGPAERGIWRRKLVALADPLLSVAPLDVATRELAHG